MKKKMLVLFILLNFIIYSTEQEPDKLIFNGEEAIVETSWEYPSMMEQYFYESFGYNPFDKYSYVTSNHRGFIAEWEIKDKKLKLSKIYFEKTVFNPKEVFIELKDNFSWFSGYVMIGYGAKQKKLDALMYGKNNIITIYTKWAIVQVLDGIVVKVTGIRRENLKNDQEVIDEHNAFRNYNRSKSYMLENIKKKPLFDNQQEILDKIELKIKSSLENER